MSEFMEKHSVSKLIGSPPGYVGYEEGGQLTERVKRTPYSIILLDEIEKAHPDIYNILLQVFEDGQLTDGLGNQVDFKNTIIIMTSNLGARFLEKRGHLGFSAPPAKACPTKIEDMVRGEVKKAFNPEFLNRLDDSDPVHLAHRRRPDQDHRPAGRADQPEPGGQADQASTCSRMRPATSSRRPAAIAAMARVRCAARCRSTSRIRCRKSLIQGTLPRPSELEVYLGDTGIYYRPVNAEAVNAEGEAAVTAGAPAEPTPGTLLYTF